MNEPEFKVEGGVWITTLHRKAAVTGVTREVTPEVAREVAPEVERLLGVVRGEMSRAEIMTALGLKDEEHFRLRYLHAAISSGVLEMTRPEAPRSRLQKYRLTERGRAVSRAMGHRGKS